jgi:hypothetical protein
MDYSMQHRIFNRTAISTKLSIYLQPSNQMTVIPNKTSAFGPETCISGEQDNSKNTNFAHLTAHSNL